jgi:lipopolysaccharide transport system permease protein
VPGVLELDSRPDTRRLWLASMWRHRDVMLTLSRADFHVRYKRASLGIAWAVLVPLVQALVLAVVFAKLTRVAAARDFAAPVLAGMIPWSYFTLTLGAGATAIVEGSGLTDKVWFPRAILPIVPSLANLPSLGISIAVLFALLPVFTWDISSRLLLLPLACLLLVVFTTALSIVLSSLHVYYRDVKFIVQAMLAVWFYLTPVAYPKALLGRWDIAADLNPMTGVVSLFQLATVGRVEHIWQRPVLITVVVTIALVVAAVESQRRYDRLFVDQL